MHYKVSGKGKVVVLIHGFVEEGSMWDSAVKVLNETHRVIVPDLPGFGKSPLETDQLSMEYYADEVYKMLKQEKVKTCTMLGHSMGGYITLYFAEKHPEMLTRFGLINSQCFEDSPQKKANRKKSIGFIRKHGTNHFVKELYSVIFSDEYKKKHPKVVNSLISKALKYTPKTLMLATEGMMNRRGKEDVLKNAKVPVLFINGKEDPSAPLALTLKQASLPQTAHIHFFAGSKHMSLFEKKKETLQIISSFCA